MMREMRMSRLMMGCWCLVQGGIQVVEIMKIEIQA